MVAYSFQRQFEAPIFAGVKRQTIRADRKRHARPGEALQLYIGMRTRSCRLIGRATCATVTPIRMDLHLGDVSPEVIARFADLGDFARADGFPDWPAMQAFWADQHSDLPVFSGVLIEWTNFQKGEDQ